MRFARVTGVGPKRRRGACRSSCCSRSPSVSYPRCFASFWGRRSCLWLANRCQQMDKTARALVALGRIGASPNGGGTTFLLVRPLSGGQAGVLEQRRGGTRMLAFLRDDEGQGLVEYALIIAVIAIAVIVAMIFLRGQIQNIFSNIGNNLT